MSFTEIIGHDKIVEIMVRTLKSGKIAHSYIFEGVTGSGRRKTALKFIQALYCQQHSNNPCGVCTSCRKVMTSNHPDIHFLEPLPDKRDISIEQIREMQRELTLRPYEANRKSCIIEPAERMNTNSANSLLKTLEEPPGNALIILLTENADILLPTIRSRCQLIRFAPLSPESIRQILVLNGVDSSKADILSTIAEGSVTKAFELDNEGLLDLQNRVIRHLASFSINRISSVFDASEDLSGNRDETLQTIDILISFMRDIVYLASGITTITNSSFQQKLQGIAAGLSLQSAVNLLDSTIETRRFIQRNANAKLSLDSLFLKIAEPSV